MRRFNEENASAADWPTSTFYDELNSALQGADQRHRRRERCA